MVINSLIIPDSVISSLIDTQGIYFEPILKLNRKKIVSDILNPERSRQQAHLIEEYEQLEKKKILEVGSGVGITVIQWHNEFRADMYGVEPCGPGYKQSLDICHQMLEANGLSQNRILGGFGENLPFIKESFDVVYSLNVLEHTVNPLKVLEESIRVLKPGGLLYFTFPNYHSFYEGHYAVFNPPILFRSFLPWYIKYICRRDPSFAKTLRSELNVTWIFKSINILKKNFSFEVLSLGDKLFYQRMKTDQIETWAGLGKVKTLVKLAAKLKLNEFIAGAMVLCKVWTPIVLVIRKK